MARGTGCRLLAAGLLAGMLPASGWASDGRVRDAPPVRLCSPGPSDDRPEIESSRLRVTLEDPDAAADRFVDFAAMSALAYTGEAASCRPDRTEPGLGADAERRLTSLLAERGWRPLTGPLVPRCEDDTGLFYRVWVRGADGSGNRDVAIAFRGTDAAEDWKTNFRFFLRWGEDQYGRARAAARAVVETLTDTYEKQGGKAPTFFSTGHSLGGGLAQSVLYDQPERFLQAITFNPSPVTGKGEAPKENRKAACACRPALGAEARIYRVYETGEALDQVRRGLRSASVPTPLDRHVHAVAFNIQTGNPYSQHSMKTLALSFLESSARSASRPDRRAQGQETGKWYRGDETCTARFEREQAQACAGKGLWKTDLWGAVFGSDCPS